MIISNINNGPRTINHSNKNPYDDVIHEKIELPYKFEDERAQKLGQAARGLRKKKRYHEAILLYSKARKIELENPLPLFYLFETYALMGDLDQAIKALDSAIVLDNSYPVLHINRGLMYYKLDNNPEAIINYKNAIQLDSTMTAVHTNLALAYYYSNEFDLACESVAKAVKLGFNVSEVKLLYEMQQSKCK